MWAKGLKSTGDAVLDGLCVVHAAMLVAGIAYGMRCNADFLTILCVRSCLTPSAACCYALDADACPGSRRTAARAVLRSALPSPLSCVYAVARRHHTVLLEVLNNVIWFPKFALVFLPLYPIHRRAWPVELWHNGIMHVEDVWLCA